MSLKGDFSSLRKLWFDFHLGKAPCCSLLSACFCLLAGGLGTIPVATVVGHNLDIKGSRHEALALRLRRQERRNTSLLIVFLGNRHQEGGGDLPKVSQLECKPSFLILPVGLPPLWLPSLSHAHQQTGYLRSFIWLLGHQAFTWIYSQED